MFLLSNVYKQSNLELAYHRLITNPESTYKNFFRDIYTAYAFSLSENIKIIRCKLKAGYVPGGSIRTFMPKANGLNRMFTLLSIEDQIVYQAYANIIAESLTSNSKCQHRYGKSVFGNLYTNSNDIFFYQEWQKSYRSYTKAIIKSYKAGNNYIASFDLTACYDSINHVLLRSLLHGKYHFSEDCANEFINFLKKIESSDGPELAVGIPQGPLASGIIAEVVLSEFDAYIEKIRKRYSFQYFRYVDDIKILSENEETTRWVLFLLDRKSKELGLLPQASKTSAHKIQDINEEIKRISKPLFDNEFDDNKKSSIAIEQIQHLLKQNPADLTTIKRYFHKIQPCAKANQQAIAMVSRFPNTVHSFAYYVIRYPRKIPPTISNYIYTCCHDKTQQFSSGILLESIIGNMTYHDIVRFLELAKTLLAEDKKSHFIIDSRYKSQLIFFVLAYGNISLKKAEGIIKRSDWWIKSKLLFQLSKQDIRHDVQNFCIGKYVCEKNCDLGLTASSCILTSTYEVSFPAIHLLSPLAQNTLKRAGIIQRSRYSTSQINRYIHEITEQPFSFQWKKHLTNEHNQLEKEFFTEVGYWKTDLTAFVNLWDTIDDRLCSIVVKDHSELGGYSLGNIGGIKGSCGFTSHIPKFYKMCMDIHDFRLSSHLSHAIVKTTHKYTGPIAQKNRRKIKKLISEGILDLINYW